jgi:RNA polymerase sigma factor (sigma-70 family)
MEIARKGKLELNLKIQNKVYEQKGSKWKSNFMEIEPEEMREKDSKKMKIEEETTVNPSNSILNRNNSTPPTNTSSQIPGPIPINSSQMNTQIAANSSQMNTQIAANASQMNTQIPKITEAPTQIENLEKINCDNCYQTRGFVVIIVRNISLDMLRRQARDKTVYIDDYSDYKDPFDLSELALDNISAAEACSKIADAISKLNKNYSDILYLVTEYGFSIEEISKILGISRGNVKMRLSSF